MYIWDRGFGNLVKVLEGPKQSLVDSDVSVNALSAKYMTLMRILVAPDPASRCFGIHRRRHLSLAYRVTRQLGGFRTRV